MAESVAAARQFFRNMEANGHSPDTNGKDTIDKVEPQKSSAYISQTNFSPAADRALVKSSTWMFWSNSPGVWDECAIEISSALDAELQIGTTEFTYERGESKYRYDMVSMTQLNLHTGKKRAIQRFGSPRFDDSSMPPQQTDSEVHEKDSFLFLSKQLASRKISISNGVHTYLENLADHTALDQLEWPAGNKFCNRSVAETLGLIHTGDAEIKTFVDRILEEKERLEARVAELTSLKTQMERENFLVQIAFKKILQGHEAQTNEERQRNSELRRRLEDERKRVHDNCVLYEQLKGELAQQVLKLEQQKLERHLKQSDCSFDVDLDPPEPWLPVIARMETEEHFEVVLDPASSEFALLEALMNSNLAQHSCVYGTVDGLKPLPLIGSAGGTPPAAFRVVQINRVHDMRLWKQYCMHKQLLIDRHRDAGGVSALAGSQYLARKPMLTPLLDPESNEFWLFHGTSAQNTRELLSYPGYDSRVSRVTGMFGGGFYLAENSSKSNQYIPCPRCGGNSVMSFEGCTSACRDAGGLAAKRYHMIVYRASLGDVHIARDYDEAKYRGPKDRPVRRPPRREDGQPFDSVLGERISNLADDGSVGARGLRFREIILYDDGRAAYPEYVVEFERLAAPDARLAGIVTRDKCNEPTTSRWSALATLVGQHTGILFRSRRRQT